VTTLDAPRSYREDVCFGHDPHVREELEQFEQKRYAGFDYPRDSDRVKALEEILEPVA
jgi:hypothetical protein